MKALVTCIVPAGLICISAMTAAGQGSATITSPSTLTDAQQATVTWTVQQASNCQSGVRVVLTLNNTNIQIGNPVQLAAGSTNVAGPIGVASGTPAILTLMDTCSGSIISPKFPITIIGNAAAPPPAPVASPITAAVQQTIDSDCQTILGLPCSTTPTYSSTYSTITQRISQGSLGSDNNSIWSYLLSMVQSSAGWQANIVDNAWRAAGCAGLAPEAQWTGRYAQWQTYQSLYNQIRQAGCGGASANVAPAAPAQAAVQFLNAQQMSVGFSTVWGGLAGFAAQINNCPVSTGAATCARGALAAYVKAPGNSVRVLTQIVDPVYKNTVGVAIDNATETSLLNSFGIRWSGADDLRTYIQSFTIAGLDQNGCLVTLAGAKLSAGEPCQMYYLSSAGISAPSLYTITWSNKQVQPKSNAASGLLVSNQGAPVHVILPSAGTWQIVAGGQIVAAGGGNIVAAGGGNIVAAGGGNIVAAGGGNIVAAGGGNVVNTNGSNLQVMSPAAAARAAGLISNNMPVISNDGGSFLPNITSIISQDGSGLQNLQANMKFVGNNGSAFGPGVLSGNGASATSIANANQLNVNNPAIVVHGGDLPPSGTNGGQLAASSAHNNLLTDNGAAYKVQSLGGSPAASNPVVRITGPARWLHGTAQVPVTWTVTNTGAPCNRGFQVYLQAGGNMADGSAVALGAGVSMVPNVSWPVGYKFNVVLWDLCTNQAVSAPVSMTIQ